MKKITLEELIKKFPDDYPAQFAYISRQVEDGTLIPIKSSGTNGKKPALCRRYWVAKEQKDYRELEEELKFTLAPAISNDYYLAHLPVYEKDRPYVQMLSEYLKSSSRLQEPESVNERSFEIWKREKFLKKERGMRILKYCGVHPDMLNYYETTEPLSYYSHTRQTPQNMIIVENKDTFYSMRRTLLNGKAGQNGLIMGVETGTIIYGAGKGILKSIQDFGHCVEPYMNCPNNKILYFGDLDYEGILIYENLAAAFAGEQELRPFVPAYEKMLEKAGCYGDGIGEKEAVRKRALLPITKEGQNRNIGTRFFSYFPQELSASMCQILWENRYIPQEILSKTDF